MTGPRIEVGNGMLGEARVYSLTYLSACGLRFTAFIQTDRSGVIADSQSLRTVSLHMHAGRNIEELRASIRQGKFTEALLRRVHIDLDGTVAKEDAESVGV